MQGTRQLLRRIWQTGSSDSHGAVEGLTKMVTCMAAKGRGDRMLHLSILFGVPWEFLLKVDVRLTLEPESNFCTRLVDLESLCEEDGRCM